MISGKRAELLPMIRSDSDPTFDEAWQAQLFAVLSVLSANGIIPPADWSAAFGKEIRRDQNDTDTADVEAYYASALKLLERLLVERGAVSSDAIDQQAARWKSAYLNTPHGHPVNLSASSGKNPG